MNRTKPGHQPADDRWPDVVAVPASAPRARFALVVASVGPVATRLGIRVAYPDGRKLGIQDPQAPLLCLHQPQATYRRVAKAGLIGFAESYQAGEWEADDLPGLLGRIATRAEGWPRLKPRGDARARPSRSGKDPADGGRLSTRLHDELRNDFFALMLDETMTYSSALFAQNLDGMPLPETDPLAIAQRRKIDHILDIAGVRKGTTLLEVGTGWGELAIVAARRGATVHTITASPNQWALAQERIAAAGAAEMVKLEVSNYREFTPSASDGYDAVVSVEMIEALDEQDWPAYFGTLERNLAPGGRIVLQSITMRHDHFKTTRGRYTWIHKYVRPSGQIPSITAIEEACRDHAGLRMHDAGAFGAHYAQTLALWRARLAENDEAVASLGFDEIFRRTWCLYLAFRQASFAEGYLDVHHLVFERSTDSPDRRDWILSPAQDSAPAAGQPITSPAACQPITSPAACQPSTSPAKPHNRYDAGEHAPGGARPAAESSSQGEAASSHWVDLGGQVHYADYGGPPGKRTLVCVHGLGGSELRWAAIAPTLALNYRVLAIDLAGFGRSRGSGPAASLPANQALLSQFLSKVVSEPAVLVGHSMGATIAAMAASRHPELVSGLVLINPAIPWVRDEIDRRLATARATLTQTFRTGSWQTGSPGQAPLDLNAGSSKPATESVLTARLIEQYRLAARGRTWSGNADPDLMAAARSLASTLLRRREFAAMLTGISAPVLWLHGEDDLAVPVGAARDAVKIRPTWQFHVAPSVGHEPHCQAPGWTIGHIQSWLDLIDTDAAGPADLKGTT